MAEHPITVKIKSTFAIGLTATLRSQLASDNELSMEVEAGTTVGELLQKLSSFGPAETFDDKMIHVFIKGKLRGFDHILQSGDRIDIHIPVSGGRH